VSVTVPPPRELLPREFLPPADPAPTAGAAATAPARERSSSVSRAVRLAPWLLLGAFLAVELAICFMQLTGPFLDEGIYVTAGLRTLQGHGIADNYLGWFSGSLLWPVIAALGWKLAGLAGARAAAALCVTAGMAGMAGAAGNLFGARVRAFAVLAAVTSGPVIALAHLAVYDTSAVAFAGGAFWALSEFLRRDDRAWLVGAALLYALAGLSKYPVMGFIASPLALLILTARGRRAALDLFMFAMVAGAVLLVYFMADRAQLIGFMSFRTHENPSFGVSTAQLAYSQFYYTAVPLLMALAGAILLARRRIVTLSPPRSRRASAGPAARHAVPAGLPEGLLAPAGLSTDRPAPAPLRASRVALALLTGVIAAPIYHLGTGNPSGDQKHVVFGLIFILPLAGIALERAFADRRRLLPAALLTAGLLVFAFAQVVRIDESWPDLRASANVLSADVHRGERLLVNSAWVEDVYLYSHGRIDTPYDLYDVYRVEHLAKPVDVCSFQWFVVVPGGEAWPAAVREQMLRCGSFREIYTARATLTNLGSNLRYITYTEPIEIWRNEAPQPRGTGVDEAPQPRATGVSGAPQPRGTGEGSATRVSSGRDQFDWNGI
jgi:4-amino-4-deoxy-L-arabinose transferase-like glycosyltransferase